MTLQAMLCKEDHSEVIAARMKQRAAQQHRQHIREAKRVALNSFLSSLDSVLPEVLQERQLFGKEVSTSSLMAHVIHAVMSMYRL
jgi:vacuolar-type H+-ATPase subunit E/Vma4